MTMTLANYVATIHDDCNRHTQASRAQAQARLRQQERLQSAQASRPMLRTVSARSLTRAWNRLRAAGLIPSPRVLPAAKPLPDATLPDWMVGLRDDELALAWLASADFPSADASRWTARAKSQVRWERLGIYSERGRIQTIVDAAGTTGKTTRKNDPFSDPFTILDDEAAEDWLARDRDDDETAMNRMAVLRRELGVKLAESLASGATQREAADICGTSVATVERKLAAVRKLVSTVS